MAGENCTSGCPTRDHESWGDCVRSKNFRPMWLGGTGPSYGEQKRFDADTALYRQAVRDGASLSTAINRGVDVAYKEAGLA